MNTGSVNDERAAALRARLGRPEYHALFAAIRERLEGAVPELVRTVTLSGLTLAERQAIADLHGSREVPGQRVRISLAKLDAALRSSAVGVGLIDAVVTLGGPLADRRAARASAAAACEQMWSRAAQHPAVTGSPALSAWLHELRALGLVARAARSSGVAEETLLDQTLEVVGRLPAASTPLSVLATELTGDSHALDAGQPLAGLVLRAAARIAGWSQAPVSAAERRRLWSDVGVACDPLSAQVLTLGLEPLGDHRLARHLRESSADGEPRRITLRELMGEPLRVEAESDVFVCENPSIVAAAADELGSRCAALVCLEGVPSTAAIALLQTLQRAGARIMFHADFDWAGIRIGNLLREQLKAASWRFTAPDYERTAAATSEAPALAGIAVEASWDSDLAVALRRIGRTVFEEQVLGTLLGDLEREPRTH